MYERTYVTGRKQFFQHIILNMSVKTNKIVKNVKKSDVFQEVLEKKIQTSFGNKVLENLDYVCSFVVMVVLVNGNNG